MIPSLILPAVLMTASPINVVDPPPALLPLPSERQLAWHDRGTYAFIHFNMNTFTDVEWGEGR